MSWLSDFLHQVAPQQGWGAAFVTAGLGAFAGGLVASRAFTKRAAIAELNALSSAQTLCFSICNRLMALKCQHVIGMKERFDRLQASHTEEVERRKQRQQAQPFVFQADFQTLTPLTLPIGTLEKIIFEKTSIRGRALVALVDLVSTIEGLNEAIEARTKLSEEIRNRKDKTAAELAYLYFGIRSPDGHIDERYRTNLDAIVMQTDDCIFFSQVLAGDIVEYANRLRRSHMWRYWLGLAKMKDADWTSAKESGLVPPEDAYKKWLSGFRKPTRWQRFKSLLQP